MKHLWHITRMETLLYLRERMAVFFTFFFPLFMLVFFGSIWGKYPAYYGMLVPMLIVMTAFSNGLFTMGYTLTHYRETGFFRRICLTSVDTAEYIYGLALSRLLMVTVQALVLVGILTFILRFSIRGGAVAVAAVFLLGTLAMFAVGMLVSVLARSGESALAICNFLFTPLMFLSGGFIPISVLPSLMQKVARVSPLYHFIHSLQDLFVNGGSLAGQWPHLAVLAACLAVCVAIARLRLFRRLS